MNDGCQKEYRYKSSVGEFNLELLNRETERFCAFDENLARELFTIQLVIEELTTNIIKYGAIKEREGGETIEIRLCARDGKAVLTVSDNTKAFNPLDVKAPDTALSAEERKIGGLGLLLIKKRVEAISYRRKDGKNIVETVI